MSRSYDDWMRVENPWVVAAAAPYSEQAREAAVSRIIDTMLEIQLDYEHVSPGWPPVSSTALACAAAKGELMCGGDGGGDPMLVAYGSAWRDSPWHCACAWLLSQLTPRMAAAMLMQAARVRPRKDRVSNFWSKTNRQLFLHQEEAVRQLGLKGRGVIPFGSERTWRLYATEARSLIRTWLSQSEQGELTKKDKNSLTEQTAFA